MVKSKNKKSVIALVVMAFLLVASIVLAATGAWFTDKEEETLAGETITFGKIDLDTVTVAGTQFGTAKVLPGDSYTATVTVKLAEGSEDAYVSVAAAVEEGQALSQYITISVKKGEANFTSEVAKMTAADTLELTITVSVSAELPNKVGETTYNGGSVEIKGVNIVAKAIQAKNLTLAEATTKLADDTLIVKKGA